MELVENIIDSKEVYKGSFLRVDKVKVELPDGNNAERDIVRHPGACAIIPFIDDDTILLVKQFRVALNKLMYEIPAGKLEKGEDTLVCAERELEEETGYKCENIEYLGVIATGAGFTDELIYIYKATDLFKGIKGGDDDEFIETIPFKIEEVKKMIKEGEIIDTKTISGLMYL